jgi:Ca2+-binding RTX toxin-like protein
MNDYYYADSVLDIVFEAVGGGYDRIQASANHLLAAGQEIEVLRTIDQNASTAINLTGNEFGQFVQGNAGANRIDGGAGSDALYGYGGADQFAFTTALGGGNVDTVADFVSGVDSFLLDDAVFAGLSLGALSPGAFRVGTAALDADDRIIYNQAAGALLFDADGVGGVAAVQFAALPGGPAVAASDFVVI